MKNNKQSSQDDDGRVIASMNVDGMPWYAKHHVSDLNKSASPQDPISIKETINLIFGALGAALLVGGAFGVAGLLFILFCQFIWLR